MIDMHTHIIPGIDDGSKSYEQSIAMIKMEIESGIDTIVFTPHSLLNHKEIPNETIRQKYEEFKIRLDEEHLPIKYYLGCEIHYTKNTLEKIKSKDYISINNSKYVLLEFKHTDDYDTISDACYNVSLQGLKPIIAHIERYNLSLANIIKLHKEGNLIQVNQRFMTFKNWLFIRKMLKEKAIDYVATDCHNLTDRKPGFGKVRKTIKLHRLNKNIFE